jgi:hypothetical protein
MEAIITRIQSPTFVWFLFRRDFSALFGFDLFPFLLDMSRVSDTDLEDRGSKFLPEAPFRWRATTEHKCTAHDRPLLANLLQLFNSMWYYSYLFIYASRWAPLETAHLYRRPNPCFFIIIFLTLSLAIRIAQIL